MQYRTFGKTDFKSSALGFGMMRLPMISKENSKVDVKEAVKIVRFAIDNGVNYLDTAYTYHNQTSEEILKEVVKNGYRDKVKIADKLPIWMVKEPQDLDILLNTQLERLGVEKIDFYLLHALSRKSIPVIKRCNIINWLLEKKREGKIDYIGFSFHDDLKTFKKIADLYSWDFTQIQYNIIDVYSQGGISAIKYAHQKGMGVVIMEPLRGGQLCQTIPQEIGQTWAEYAKTGIDNIKPVQYLLDWIWNHKEVSIILSGMSDMQQTRENVYYAAKSGVGKLTERQLKIVRKIRKLYKERIVINCTSCKYCRVCPQKIPIPYIFDLVNQVKQYDSAHLPKLYYKFFISDDHKISSCLKCNKCNEVCPQKLDIPALFDKVEKVLSQDEPIQIFLKD